MESIAPWGTKQHYNRGLVEGSWKGMKKYLERKESPKSKRKFEGGRYGISMP